MAIRHWMQVAGVAAALGLAGPALAAEAGATTAQMQNGPSPAGSVQQALPPGPASVGGSERIDNSNGVPLSDAARVYASENGGQLPPAVIVDDAGRAWDVVGFEPATGDDAHALLLRPHGGADVIVVTPGSEGTTYVEPDGTRVIYLVPEAMLEDDAASAGGGMQATPGADGPDSPKGQ
jgi:hypothetical protein